MKVTVEATLRRRKRMGVGPFRIDRWEDHRLQWAFDTRRQSFDEYAEVAERIELAVENAGGRYFVRARIKGRPYLLADTEVGDRRSVNFSVLSMAGMEISGRVQFEPEAGEGGM